MQNSSTQIGTEKMLYIEEVFSSINGESTDAGLPTVFVRLFGCNIHCIYCDQKQDTKNKKKISVGNLVSAIQNLHVRNVCITGGEPLLQPDVYPLIYELVGLNYTVSVETSGCVEIEPDYYNRGYKYVMDVKCPSSGVSHKNVLKNLAILHMKDEVKFVIGNRKDYEFAKHVLRSYPTMAKILFSPVFDEELKPVIGKELIEWVLADNLNVRIQIQIHKILGVK